LELDLVDLLLAAPALQAVVADRIKWDVLPQGGIRPAIVLYGIAGVPDYAMSGPTGLVSSVVQADCQGATKADALAAASALKSVLSGYRGDVGSTRFGGAFVTAERQSFSRADDGAGAWHLVSLDFAVWHGSLA